MAASIQPGINALPDSALLEIFSYLNVKDLCKSGRVCRRWRQLSHDKSLWRYVSFCDCLLSLQNLRKVMRAYFPNSLRSLHIQGKVRKFAATPKWNTETISNSFLSELGARCPHLEQLVLSEVFMDNIFVDNLPPSLTTLDLEGSLLPYRWFEGLANNKVLPKLRCLILNGCTRISNFDLADISRRKTIQVLHLGKCYRINDRGMEVMGKLTNLLELHVPETVLTDRSLHHLGHNLHKLTTLDVCSCKKISDRGMAYLANGLKHLKHLNIQACKCVSDDGLKHLSALKQLRTLNVTNTGITVTGITQLKSLLPNCIVEDLSQTNK